MEMQTAVKNPHIHMPNNATKLRNSRFHTTILHTLAFFFFWGGGAEAAPQPCCSPLTPLRARCRRLLTEEQKRLYAKVAQYCNRSTDLIPISFVLGTGPSPAPSQLGDAPSCPRAQTAPLPGAGWHSAPKATEHSSLALFQD